MRQFVVDDRGNLLEMEIAEQLLDLVRHDGGSSPSSGTTKYAWATKRSVRRSRRSRSKRPYCSTRVTAWRKAARGYSRERARSRRRASVPRPALRALSAVAQVGTGGSAAASACSSGDGWVARRAPRGGRCSGTVTRVKVRTKSF